MACKYYDITISGLDIADATGNTIFPNLNGKVFVKYTDCFGIEQEVGYDTPGTYVDEICANNNESVLVGFYSDNDFDVTLNSIATEEFVCSDGFCPGNLITNPTFDTNLNGWLESIPGEWDWSSNYGGTAHFIGFDNYNNRLYQDVLTVGSTYNISFTLYYNAPCTNDAYVKVFAGTNESSLIQTGGEINLTLTCTDTNRFAISAYDACGVGAGSIYVDNVCVTLFSPPCQCITVVSRAGSIPYQYTDCSGDVISDTSPPIPSAFTVCGSNPSTSFPKFMTFGVGGVCNDGVNCDVPCLDTCSILLNDFNIIYGYDYTSNISTILNPYFDVEPIGSNDITHTTNKLWVYSSKDLYEYDITLCPFSAVFNRIITLPDFLGAGLTAINDTTLISSSSNNIVQIDISGPSATVTTQFPMPSGRDISGDMVYTYAAPHKLICSYVDNTDTTYITQHDYSTGVVEVDVIVSPTIPAPYGMFMNSGDLYVCNGGGQLYNFELTPPYNLTYTKTVSNTIGGASQPPICADITIMGPTSTPTPTPTNTPTLTNTQTPTNTQTQTQTPTNTQTQTQTPTNTLTPTQTPSTTPISCGFGLIKTNSEYYYTDCCGNFISGFNNTGDGLQVSFNYNEPRSGVGKLSVPATTLCSSPTPTPTPTITPTNTASPTVTPTNTITPTQSVTPSVTPSNRPVTKLKNDCDVTTLFDLGISCNVIQSPTESNPEGGILSVNVTGGTAPYTFTWNGNGGHNQTLFGIPAGSYEVVVTDYAWPDGGPNGVSDYTATTICVLAGPVPTSTPTMTPTPSQTPPIECVDLCLIAIGEKGVDNFGPIQFVCDGTQNGRFRWTSDRYQIIWNVTSTRWEIYTNETPPVNNFLPGGGILASTTFNLIPDSAWTVLGGTDDYPSITMTRGNCPTSIPLQISIDKTNSSCQGNTNCNGSITIIAQDGYPPYTYSIDGGITNGSNYAFWNLCPNTYSVVVTDSQNNAQSTSISVGFNSSPTTYQLSLTNVGAATPIIVPNVSKTITQVMELVVTPPLPVGVSVTFDLTSTAERIINSPGVADSTVTWNVTKNGQLVNTVIGPTTVSSQGTRPFCSVNDTQLINSTVYSNSITITNGDVISITSNTVNTIINGQVSSQTNCTTNIKTTIAGAILTPTIVGNNCSSVIGSSRQVQTNDFTYVPSSSIPSIETRFASIREENTTNNLLYPSNYGSPTTSIIGSPNDNLTIRFSVPALNSVTGTTTVLGTAFTETTSSTFNINLDSSGNGRITGTTVNTSTNFYGQKILKFEIIGSSNNTPISNLYSAMTVNYVVQPPGGNYGIWNGVSSISATTSNQSCSNYSQTNSYTVNDAGNIPVVGKIISNSGNNIINGNNNWITIVKAPSLGSSSSSPVVKYSIQVNSSGVITNVVPCT